MSGGRKSTRSSGEMSTVQGPVLPLLERIDMKAVVFDTETTGLIENQTVKIDKLPEVIEFYGALWDLKKGKMIEEAHYLIKPSKPLSEETKSITRFRDEDFIGKASFAKAAVQIRGFIEKAPIMIAHNASFDKEICDIEFKRLGETVSWPRVLCTVEQTIHIKGFRLSMTALHEYLFGEGFPDAHRADADSKALARVCCELFKRGYL